jgi:hypothetical protein
MESREATFPKKIVSPKSVKYHKLSLGRFWFRTQDPGTNLEETVWQFASLVVFLAIKSRS